MKEHYKRKSSIALGIMLIALMMILFKGNFLMIKYIIVLFLTDMVIRVFINPRFAPMLIIGWRIIEAIPKSAFKLSYSQGWHTGYGKWTFVAEGKGGFRVLWRIANCILEKDFSFRRSTTPY